MINSRARGTFAFDDQGKQYKEKDQVGESKLRKVDPTHTETRRTTSKTRR